MERRSRVEPCLSDMVDPILHGSFLFGRQMVQRAAIRISMAMFSGSQLREIT